MDIIFFKDSSLVFKTEKNSFSGITKDEFFKYIKTRFTNIERFKQNFSSIVEKKLKESKEMQENHQDDIKIILDLMKEIENEYDNIEKFTYKEAFSLENDDFKSLVFGSIRVPEMIKELGHTRIKVEGIPVKHKKFDKEGNFIGMEEYDVVYETHEVKGKGLDLNENLYAVRCWCTSTNEEHWLWIDDQYKDQPLEAIAHTFVIHENLIPYIKELKRQGDVLLVELTEEGKNISPQGEKVALNKDQYFGLLTAQS